MSDIDDCLKSVERLTRERGEVMAKAERLRAEVERLRGDMPVAESLRVNAKCAEIERDEARAAVWKQAKEIADLRAEVERLRASRKEARAEIENLYDQIHRWVDDRAKAQSQADRLREQNYELQRERDEARAWAAKLLATLEMVRDADNDCRVEGWATIPDAARRSIDEALEAKP